MKKKQYILFGLFLFSFFALAFSQRQSQSQKEEQKELQNSKEQKGQELEFSFFIGHIIAKGNEPFVVPYLQTKDEKQYRLISYAQARKDLLEKQGLLLKIRGKKKDERTIQVVSYSILD